MRAASSHYIPLCNTSNYCLFDFFINRKERRRKKSERNWRCIFLMLLNDNKTSIAKKAEEKERRSAVVTKSRNATCLSRAHRSASSLCILYCLSLSLCSFDMVNHRSSRHVFLISHWIVCFRVSWWDWVSNRRAKQMKTNRRKREREREDISLEEKYGSLF